MRSLYKNITITRFLIKKNIKSKIYKRKNLINKNILSKILNVYNGKILIKILIKKNFKGLSLHQVFLTKKRTYKIHIKNKNKIIKINKK